MHFTFVVQSGQGHCWLLKLLALHPNSCSLPHSSHLQGSCCNDILLTLDPLPLLSNQVEDAWWADPAGGIAISLFILWRW
jgi:hypothetical protein